MAHHLSEDGLWLWDGLTWVPVEWAAQIDAARAARDAGAALFQCELDITRIEPVVKIQHGAKAEERRWNPSPTLNLIAGQGWELASSSVVFIEFAQQIRERVMSGQTVGLQAVVRGYYLFKRIGGRD